MRSIYLLRTVALLISFLPAFVRAHRCVAARRDKRQAAHDTDFLCSTLRCQMPALVPPFRRLNSKPALIRAGASALALAHEGTPQRAGAAGAGHRVRPMEIVAYRVARLADRFQ